MDESTKNPQSNFVGGALWMTGLRWAQRLIGLFSTIILARLLMPADFGIVALALIVVGLIEVLSITAVDLAVIRNQDATREHYDTAWTIQIIQATIVSSLLILIAPYAADYFNEAAITDVVRLLALSIFITGFQNIGTLDFRKELNFSQDFRFQLYKKICSFIFIVSLAFILRNYWALVIGTLATAVVDIFLSYKMHPFRPKISFSRMHEIWSFSQWMLLSRIGYFLNQKTDQFLIGGTSNTAVMGTYHISAEIATMPTSEVAMPLRRAFFPNFSIMTDKPEEFKSSILKVIGFLSIAIFPAGMGISAISEDFVLLVLGEKWEKTIPFIEILAIFGIAAAFSRSLEMLLLVSGRGDLSTIESWLQLAVLFPAIYYAAHYSDILSIAYTRTVIACLFTPIMIYLVTIATPVNFTSVLSVVWRPLFAAVIMFFVVKTCQTDTINLIVIRISLDILIGILSFSSSLFIIWYLSGRAAGAEQDIFLKLQLLIKEKIYKK